MVGGYDTCQFDDFACLAMAHNDRLELEAIKSLHKQLDDDKDGNIDLSESDDVSLSKIKTANSCGVDTSQYRKNLVGICWSNLHNKITHFPEFSLNFPIKLRKTE